jgi:hypothetical protein
VSSGELERLQNARGTLENALHEMNDLPVDVSSARTRLASHLALQRQSVQRRRLMFVAASVVVAVLATIMLADLRADHQSLPARPAPELTFSPSGLPVGLLQAKVDRTQEGARSTVRMVVRSDGTGVFNAGTVGDSNGDSTQSYDVEFAREEPGHAVMKVEDGCNSPETLRLEFSVHGRAVVIHHASTNACLVGQGLAQDMTGITLRVHPLPRGT